MYALNFRTPDLFRPGAKSVRECQLLSLDQRIFPSCQQVPGIDAFSLVMAVSRE